MSEMTLKTCMTPGEHITKSSLKCLFYNCLYCMPAVCVCVCVCVRERERELSAEHCLLDWIFTWPLSSLICKIWYHCIDCTTTQSLTEFVAKLYTWNESPSCSFYITVNYYGFNIAVLWLRVLMALIYHFPGTTVSKLFVDMLLDDSAIMYCFLWQNTCSVSLF